MHFPQKSCIFPPKKAYILPKLCPQAFSQVVVVVVVVLELEATPEATPDAKKQKTDA